MIRAPNTRGQKFWVSIVQWTPETSVSEEIAGIFRNYNIDGRYGTFNKLVWRKRDADGILPFPPQYQHEGIAQEPDFKKKCDLGQHWSKLRSITVTTRMLLSRAPFTNVA